MNGYLFYFGCFLFLADEPPDAIRREMEELRQQLAKQEEARAEEKKQWEERLRKLEEEFDLQKLQARAAEEIAEPSQEGVGQQGFLSRFASALNPSLTLIGNAFARLDDRKVLNENGERIDDQVNVREVEIDARAAVDPYADGVFTLAFESEVPGEGEVHVEEAYVRLKRLPFLEKPPLGLKLRGGRFRPTFGKMNLLHTHDLPQTVRPLVVEEFLGDEGFHANGGSAEFFIPAPWDREGSLDFTFQALDAGHLAAAAEARNEFAYLAHLRWFRTFADAHNLELGASGYWGPTDPDGKTEIFLGGIDFFYRWKPLRGGEWRSLLLGGEIFAADREFVDAGSIQEASPLGYYLMAQYQIGPRLYAGARWDWTQSIEDDRIETYGVIPSVSYYLSEFLRLRLNYQRLWSDLDEKDGRDTVFFEVNFLIGAHPPHPFWVNK